MSIAIIEPPFVFRLSNLSPGLSPEQEMVEDLLAIVHTFSCRLYGMRKYKKQLKEDYPQAKEPKELLS